jgi:predicted RNase H-like nuclease (RuvC/YqgF family)
MTLLLPGTGLANEEADDLKSEVVQMRQSIDELVQTLKSQQQETSEFQDLQIAVTYLSFRSRSIELKEWALSQKKESRERMEDMIARIEADPDKWDQRSKAFQSSSSLQSSSDIRPSEQRINMLQERIESLDTEIVKAELEIQDVKDELATYEAFIQKKLNIEN